MVVKTRKQGNSITITIPSEFNIPSGVKTKRNCYQVVRLSLLLKNWGSRFLMYLMMPLT
ncbi:toxin-antitoxin system, antitoxin component,AbrB family [Streptococcus pneumoniae]|nr:toxin-antitoxin system, antitoxin component,AbrB family [Streptococcus pneumoniae]